MAHRRILILLGVEDWLSQSMVDTELVDACSLYRNIHGFSKLICKVQSHLSGNGSECRYSSAWTEYIAEYDTVILFDVFDDSKVIKYLCQHAPETRLIVYYYNKIKRTDLLRKVQQLPCEVWSFDNDDAKRFGLRYNPQFYFKNLNFKDYTIRNLDYKSDVFFVGKDKGRLPELMDFEEKLKQMGVVTKFIVVADRKQSYTQQQKKYLGKHISYAECIEYVKQTNCIFDIVQKNQRGMTLRIMEALFFNKKLITNNDEILNMDFYDPSNIYVLGRDNRSMEQFILGNKAHWKEQFVEKYNFENWLANFDNMRREIQ